MGAHPEVLADDLSDCLAHQVEAIIASILGRCGERLDERLAFLRCPTGASQQIDNNLTGPAYVTHACIALDNRVERLDEYDVRTAIDGGR